MAGSKYTRTKFLTKSDSLSFSETVERLLLLDRRFRSATTRRNTALVLKFARWCGNLLYGSHFRSVRGKPKTSMSTYMERRIRHVLITKATSSNEAEPDSIVHVGRDFNIMLYMTPDFERRYRRTLIAFRTIKKTFWGRPVRAMIRRIWPRRLSICCVTNHY